MAFNKGLFSSIKVTTAASEVKSPSSPASTTKQPVLAPVQRAAKSEPSSNGGPQPTRAFSHSLFTPLPRPVSVTPVSAQPDKPAAESTQAAPSVSAPVQAPSPARLGIGIGRLASNTSATAVLPEIDIVPDVQSPYEFERINGAQVRYEPVSKLTNTGAVIPESMAEPTRKALLALDEKVGGIDEWVARRLQWSLDHLESVLSAEQIDAVALSIDAADRDAGLIVADQTGFGKGRIIAATCRAMALDGKPVIFFSEKENLFSDFWRDIRDIGSEDVFGRPFLLNDGSRIINTGSVEAEVLVPHWKPKEKREAIEHIIETGTLPEGSALMMATYSQFNRVGTKKSLLLQALAPSAHIAEDEAHNAVTDSATSKVVGDALAASKSSMFSSATFGRHVNNLSAYRSVFPWLKSMENLEDLSPAQRRALAEESTSIATLAGQIIRREHDLTNMVLTVKIDEKRQTRNEEYADILAPILALSSKLSSLVDRLIDERNETNKAHLNSLKSDTKRKEDREVWASANFGTKLNAITGQFLIALSVDHCVEECLETLERGEKPVVVIESTMESLMKMLSDVVDGDEEHEEASASGNVPTFRKSLEMMADRLLKVSVRRGVEYIKQEVWLDEPELVAMQSEIRGLIAGFPELSLSPIDDIRDRVEREGQKLFDAGKLPKPPLMDEISARNTRVVDGKYVRMPSEDRNVRVARFVNGATSGLILTEAGSTGLSAHDSDRFQEHARRHMVELAPPSNVIKRVQTWGRVWRRGQLTEPRFTVLATGLPFQIYKMAIQNQKVEELSASVTGSANTLTKMDVPDPINPIGNDVAYDFLNENPKIADHLGIAMSVNREEADREMYFVGKLLRRLPLLGSEMQRKVFGAFISAYRDRLKTATSKNSGRHLPGIWQPVSRKVFEAGDGSDNPYLGPDIWATTIRTTEHVIPLHGEKLLQLLSRRAYQAEEAYVIEHLRKISEHRPGVLERALHKKTFPNVAAALRSQKENAVKIADLRLTKLSAALRNFSPGIGAVLPNEDADPVAAIVLGLKLPEVSRATIARDYAIEYLIPGEEKPRQISLDGVFRDERFKFMDRVFGEKQIAACATAESGHRVVERVVLEGNMLSAIMASSRMGFGTKTAYVSPEGKVTPAILIPKSAERTLVAQSCRTVIGEVAAEVLRAGGVLRSNQKITGSGIELKKVANDQVLYTIPYAKRAAKPFETAEIVDITGKITNGDWSGRFTRLTMSQANQLIELFYQKGVYLTFDAKFRKMAVEKTWSWIDNNSIVGPEPQETKMSLSLHR
ncbi:strawberry notch C-terminal domain-containing protein [Thalassospira xiamenensis]|uniref:P-loop containing NTP hydrolase pore-1 n=1 Tax=Thalassospira xiamenensis TaxID=220697 RepID=A0A285TT11_9PROT|nr:strawberry notch C-terminal domain-containing protein [Thalassospira xiamenensis]SOC27123.1 P-loop containing NTP hydrolase pore-1 [Thalassospira xiamenensis]